MKLLTDTFDMRFMKQSVFLCCVLQFVSKRHPEDVKEVVVWRRYSELKKLHGELAYTHKNLFRRQEEFPFFPPAQVFGMMGCSHNQFQHQEFDLFNVFCCFLCNEVVLKCR